LAHSEEVAGGKDPRLELECHKTVLKYTEAELKSVEIKAPPDEHRRVRVSLFDVVDAECVEIPKQIEE
jgi:hypothetical protein